MTTELIERVARCAGWRVAGTAPTNLWYESGERNSEGRFIDDVMGSFPDEWGGGELTNDGLRQLEDRLLKAEWELSYNRTYEIWWWDSPKMDQFTDASKETATMVAYLAAFEDKP